MTRNIEFEISLFELLMVIKNRWKWIVVSAIFFTVLGGIVGFVRGYDMAAQADGYNAGQIKEKEHYYKENLKMNDDYSEVSQEDMIRLKKEWLSIAKLQSEHPVMSLDPFNCEFETITLHFEEESGVHNGMVYNWIQNADEEKIFGRSVSTLAKYKNSLIIVSGSNNETIVDILKVKGMDSRKATSYLKGYLLLQAEKADLPVIASSTAHSVGYLYEVADFQKQNHEYMNDVYSIISNYNDAEKIFFEYEKPETFQGDIRKHTLFKHIYLGLLIGIIVSMLFIMVITIMQRRIISRRQIEDTFDLELLSDCSNGYDIGIELLNVNLDVMIGKRRNVMLLESGKGGLLDDFVSKWNEKSERSFIIGKDIFEDSKTIDALQNVEGIVLVVRISESRLEDMQRIIIRAEKLGKKILGFIEV